VVRALEAGAVGLLIACIALVPLLGYRFWHREDSGQISLAVTALGGAVGIVIGWLRRPSPLASALLADSQLQFKELLSTAWVFRDGVFVDCKSVLDSADQAMRQAKSSSVKVRSMTSRGWGVTALAAILAAVLCVLIPARPAEQNQTANAESAKSDSAFALADPDRPLVDLTSSSAGPNVRPNPEDPDASRLGQNAHASRAGQDNNSEVNPSSTHRDQTNSAEGRGGGAGRTNYGDAPAPAIDQTSLVRGKEASNGASSEGSGTTANQTHPPGDGRASSGITSTISSSMEAPPWRSNSWQDNVQRAQQAISSGSVPTSYRDLVRAYFQSH